MGGRNGFHKKIFILEEMTGKNDRLKVLAARIKSIFELEYKIAKERLSSFKISRQLFSEDKHVHLEHLCILDVIFVNQSSCKRNYKFN